MRDVELQQAVHNAVVLFGFLVDGFEQVGRVDAVDERDKGDDVFDFVGLQMADEMPLDILREHLMLVAHFKGMVLAENALTSIVGFLQVADGLGLADGYQSY